MLPTTSTNSSTHPKIHPKRHRLCSMRRCPMMQSRSWLCAPVQSMWLVMVVAHQDLWMGLQLKFETGWLQKHNGTKAAWWCRNCDNHDAFPFSHLICYCATFESNISQMWRRSHFLGVKTFEAQFGWCSLRSFFTGCSQGRAPVFELLGGRGVRYTHYSSCILYASVFFLVE